jgi:hypothetical protein
VRSAETYADAEIRNGVTAPEAHLIRAGTSGLAAGVAGAVPPEGAGAPAQPSRAAGIPGIAVVARTFPSFMARG